MTQNEITVRPLTDSDLPAVLEIEKACFADPWPETVFRSALGDELSTWLAAEQGGRLIAYAGMQTVLDEGYVDNVAVIPTARRRGAARALLGAFLQMGADRGLRFLSLEVRAGNAGAIALYSSLGFETVGRRKGYYLRPPEDALIMTKYYAEEARP